jgi:hypothetical protein
MAASLRFTKEERELIRKWAGEDSVIVRRDTGKRRKTACAILDKLEKSELLKPSAKVAGIGWKVALEAMREILGARLAAPPSPDSVWMIRMSNRIRELGLTPDNCRAIARELLARGWKVYSFDYAIRYADTLLQEATLETTLAPGPRPPRAAAPLSM